MSKPPSVTADAVTSTNQDDMDVAFFETAPYWSNLAVAILSVLAAIAAAFALYTSSRFVSAKNAEIGRVQAASKLAIASADARAAEADQRASSAAASAAAAAERARELELEAAQQRARATGNTQRGAGAPAAAPEDDRAVNAEPKPLAVQTGSRGRRLAPEQRQAMVSVLKAASSPRHVTLSWVATSDTYTFAKDIWGALEAAGWRVTAAGGQLTPSPPVDVSMATSVLSNDTVLLESAFETIGIELSIALEAAIPEDEIRLTIGDSR